jgi:SAM-dependent methyltransferase
LVRSIELARSLRRAGREARLFARAPVPGIEDLRAREEELRARSWGLIVLDRFRTPPEELEFWAAFAPVLGIDEGGKARDRFDFLIDLLPGIAGFSPPNLRCPAFLPLPEKRRPSFAVSAAVPRVLITFGAEDAAGLTVPAALALAGTARITVRFGPLNRAAGEKTPLEKAGIIMEEDSGTLRESFAAYDLVITHFGLTAFEALFARVPVVLASPTPYHEQLARNAGFVSAGTGKRGVRRLRSLLCVQGLLDGKKIRAVAERSNAAAKRWGMDGEARDFGAFLAAWQPQVYRACPVCGAFPGGVLARFPDRSYRRCPDCGMVFMDRTCPPDQRYDASYFFEDYRKQYGKTYLEDFPALKERGKRRLIIITSLLGNSPAPRLLDAGCAYGPFLAAAKEAGFDGEGIDPCEEAVRHVRETLNIPARQGLFPAAFSGGETKYRVLTLWYVIEHLSALGEALVMANRLLEPGGVLAFSTPSFGGISRRVSLRGFLEKSPGDHRTIWEPCYCAGILARFGFRLRREVITGHHPERFPLPGFLRRNGAVFAFCGALSRILGWGDTFEVYAVKERECPEY